MPTGPQLQRGLGHGLADPDLEEPHAQRSAQLGKLLAARNTFILQAAMYVRGGANLESQPPLKKGPWEPSKATVISKAAYS